MRRGASRFDEQLLAFDVAGIATHVLMAVLATKVVLAGALPRPGYARCSPKWRAVDSAPMPCQFVLR